MSNLSARDRTLTLYLKAAAAVTQTPLRIVFARPWPSTRRGFKLWLFATILGARGLIYALEPASQSNALLFPVEWMDTRLWGVTVVAVCSIAAFTSYCHLGRDRHGYKLMTGLSVIWAFIYGYGYVFQGAAESAMQGVLSFALIAVLLMHCAGDPEMPAGGR